MNYEKIYNQLIEKCKNRGRIGIDVYTEIHHILPRCMGGNDDETNLVQLTGREHFIAHALLSKFVTQEPYSSKLKNAFFAMCNQKSIGQENRYRPSSKIYNIAKNQHAEVMSKTHSGKKLTEEHIIKLRQGHKNYFSIDENIKKHSETIRKISNDESVKNKKRENAISLHKNIDYTNNVKRGLKEFYNSERGSERKRQISEKSKLMWKNDEFKAEFSKKIKTKWDSMSDEEYLEECIRRKNNVTDEFRLLMSTISKENAQKIHKKVQCEHCNKIISKQNYSKFHGEKCSVITGVKHTHARVKCIHCGKECSPSTLSRWHNDNCKIANSAIK